jgi:hypothetical protein
MNGSRLVFKASILIELSPHFQASYSDREASRKAALDLLQVIAQRGSHGPVVSMTAFAGLARSVTLGPICKGPPCELPRNPVSKGGSDRRGKVIFAGPGEPQPMELVVLKRFMCLAAA